eukprot:gnl/TRDRNA2_/TRDRNA2_197849_c0_seq1.p1 gnl/TRDRNA2_/TRDRNA2_197849_c0~~gnl/TRDRNA2_/TRDRNA2_197849_c0_seq1.p1  ORF type:complete len:209 (-),score=39.88 gnl/TRDRNA2_/TRDRNA2_197849_c0_seq1:192-818(-)
MFRHCCCTDDALSAEGAVGAGIPIAAGRVSLPHEFAIAEYSLRTSGRLNETSPPDFSVRSVDSSALSALSGRGASSRYVSLDQEQKVHEMEKLQEMVREFVRDVLQGVLLDVVLDGGMSTECCCSMNNSLSFLIIKVRDTVRSINLADIKDIFSGTELRRVHTGLPLDEFCVTLVLKDEEEYVAFKFKDVISRETFATCMKVLRAAQE